METFKLKLENWNGIVDATYVSLHRAQIQT